MDKVKTSTEASPNLDEIQHIFDEINGVVNFSVDLYSGVKELKNDVS